MRRDICIGLLASALFDCGLVLTSTHPVLAPLLRAKAPDYIAFILPPIPPEDPPEESADEAKKPIEVSVPSIIEVPEIPPPNGFVQPLQAPAPDPSTSPIVIKIPTADRNGNPDIKAFEPSDLDQGPMAITRSAPAYPFQMRQSGIEGTVLVDFIVDPHGAVQRAYAVSSSNSAFEPAAVQGVSKWKFRAGRKGGRPVYTHMQVPIVFSLNQTD